jgi:SRSO17 transposase
MNDEPNLAPLAAAFAAYHARFAPLFFRAEVRARSRRYLHGLLGPVERKNGWQLAEAVGEADPQGIQRLLYEARWDADAVRDAYQHFVAEVFGDPDAVLVLDETGFLKCGTKSTGVQRQYSGTAGKVENCQLGVFLAYVSPRGHLLLDRRLYLPHGWATDPQRCAEAKVPADVTFQTMPALGQAMVEHARAQGIPHGWVTGDERYGGDPTLLAALEAHGTRYVMAVASSTRVWPAGTTVVDGPGRVRILCAAAPRPSPVADLVAAWPADGWRRLGAGAGAKGPRVHDWAAARVIANRDQWPGPELWLLVRRSPSDPTDLAYYLAFAPADTPLEALMRVAASRWSVEQCFEEAKGETGLDQYEVRSWPSWHRHITLSMLAHGFLAWQRREAGEKRPAAGAGPGAAERAGTAAVAHDPRAPAVPDSGLPARLVEVASAPPGPRPASALPCRWAPPSTPRPYLRLYY